MTPSIDDTECCVFDIQIYGKHQTFDTRSPDETSTNTMNQPTHGHFSQDTSYQPS